MESIELETYFESLEDGYYDYKYIVKILEELFGKNFDEITNIVESVQVVVTEEQVASFLDKKFQEENPSVKSRIELRKVKKAEEIARRDSEERIFGYYIDKPDVSDHTLEFGDNLIAGRYHFEPYTLEYFRRYIKILRDKILLMLSIIEKIGNRNTSSIQELLGELDVELDENGDVSKEDIVRLIKPTIYNINSLLEKVRQANELSTYLTFKVSKRVPYEEMYPCSSLQIKDIYNNEIKGNVPLSKKQKEEINKSQENILKEVTKMVLSL